MAYTDDAVLAKLSALNETQESIVTVAQWVMFHRRHADRTGQLWLQRLKDSGSNKRLNLIYLANEVAQQSKARRKDDFLIAFSPVIAEATATSYKGATNEVQQKLRRVVEVWRGRQIFDPSIQESIEARIDELDKNRTSAKRAGGGSLFSSSADSVPKELLPIVQPQQTLSKNGTVTRTSINTANQDYDKLTDPSIPVPSAPVHAARLNGLLKTLATAEGAVAESIKARKLLIEGLEKLLDTNRASLVEEESHFTVIAERRVEIDTKKKEVEDSIMRGFSNPTTPIEIASPGLPIPQQSPATPGLDPDRPEVEAITPPTYGAPVDMKEEVPKGFDLNGNGNGYASVQSGVPGLGIENSGVPGLGVQNGASTAYGSNTGRPGSAKKRKLDNEFPDLGGEDLDADVAEMLRQG